jgi:hypothetical protein
MAGSYQQEQVFDAFLKLLNVSTIQEARQLPSSALITANLIQVGLQRLVSRSSFYRSCIMACALGYLLGTYTLYMFCGSCISVFKMSRADSCTRIVHMVSSPTVQL